MVLTCSLNHCPCTLSACNGCICCKKCGAIIEQQPLPTRYLTSIANWMQMGAGQLHSALAGLDEPSPAGSHIERYMLRTPWNRDDERLVASTFRRGHLSPLPAWYPQAGARMGVPDRMAVPCVGMGLAMAPAHTLAIPLFPNGVCVAASKGAIPRKMSLSGRGRSHSEKGVVVWQGRNEVEDGVWTLGRSPGPSWSGVTTIGQGVELGARAFSL